MNLLPYSRSKAGERTVWFFNSIFISLNKLFSVLSDTYACVFNCSLNLVSSDLNYAHANSRGGWRNARKGGRFGDEYAYWYASPFATSCSLYVRTTITRKKLMCHIHFDCSLSHFMNNNAICYIEILVISNRIGKHWPTNCCANCCMMDGINGMNGSDHKQIH